MGCAFNPPAAEAVDEAKRIDAHFSEQKRTVDC